MVELGRVPELRPARRPPRLLPARVRVGPRTVAPVDEARLRSIEYLLSSKVALQRGLVAGDSVAGIEADKVGEVAMCVGRRVHVDLPFYNYEPLVNS